MVSSQGDIDNLDGLQIGIQRSIVQDAFARVRKSFHLGLGELQVAIEAVDVGFGGKNYTELGTLLRSLWCHSREDQVRWVEVWQQMMAHYAKQEEQQRQLENRESEEISTTNQTQTQSNQSSYSPSSPKQEERIRTEGQQTGLGLSPLPVKVPTIEQTLDEFELRSVGPVTRRSMSYGWRSMRRLRADGMRDVVDMAATVRRVAQRGLYEGPVLRRRWMNHARLVLLIDQQGSMVPFHRMSRDLVETAMGERGFESVRVVYFYNVPQDFLYEDEQLTQPIALKKLLLGINQETTVIIVSDAGAARGRLDRDRLREMTQVMAKIMVRTETIGWLNPMPKSRWMGSSAEILACLVPMMAMDREGFLGLLDGLMGRGDGLISEVG